MKKEARIHGEKMFLRAGGKITNVQIARAVKVNPLTVGRWKRADKWEEKLKEIEQARAKEPRVGVVRKKVARDQAVALYMKASGNITNKELALKVRVSPSTISKWKERDNWIEKINFEAVEPEETTQPVPEKTELDLGELSSPEQIIQINRKIDLLLRREDLTASEVADIACAKADLLEALETYVTIVRQASGKGSVK